MYSVIITKSFNKNLRNAMKKGAKRSVMAAKAAMTEASISGEISSLPRTKHGESRISNVEKYDLPDAFRLIVQLVDGVKKTRAFLFIGSHDEADHWLDVHKNYKWVKNKSDGILDFVLVTEPDIKPHVPGDRVNLDVPEDILEKPLLEKISEQTWRILSIDPEAEQIAKSITGDNFEQDADGILEKLSQIVGYETSSILFDLMWHAHSQEWIEFNNRILIINGESEVISSEEASNSMQSGVNSESFITFNDKDLLDDFLSTHDIKDWMLFLHPEQKVISDRDFRGAARLRGVSGSGKTCVLVHRARYLAKKYREPVLLVTLTESMRKLLDRLVDDLCGVERALISTKTISSLAREIVHVPAPLSEIKRYNHFTPEERDRLLKNAENFIRGQEEFEKSSFVRLTPYQIIQFLQREIPYIRGRLTEANFDDYLNAKLFQRTGRGRPLAHTERKIILDTVKFYVRCLENSSYQDHQRLVSNALDKTPTEQKNYRCVLCDEVQDLSELDVTLLGRLKNSSGQEARNCENGLFLAGDGAQSLYNKGFSLKRAGIDVSGRSVSLKKNYRNTYEILKAAFGLVSKFEFADVDEENIARPSTPDFAERHGSKPLLIRCDNQTEETKWIAKEILSLLTMGQTPGQICVIGTSNKIREEIERNLRNLGIDSMELKQDIDYESDNVKISTIESAKGHEFGYVYIAGIDSDVFSSDDEHEIETRREASRLYVAMTRARESLIMTYNGTHPSPLLHAIQDDCKEAYLRGEELRYID